MKKKVAWMLLVVFMLFITCTVAGARTVYYGYFWGSSFGSEQRAQWSIYEGRLVPSGEYYYSPYAFNYGHSGLVPQEFYYSPYAFSYGQSGLVSKYSAKPYCIVVVKQDTDVNPYIKQEIEKQKRYKENVEARRRKVEERKRELAAARTRVAARAE